MSKRYSDVYVVPGGEGEVEVTIKRSRFIARVRVVRTEEEAREAVKAIAQSETSANHHCWAYRVGFPHYREYFSDAGEPSGSAGKPILGAIQKEDVTHAVVVVTRYFGGIKLGVRGLIEAYGKTASLALRESGRREEQLGRNLFARIAYEGQRPLFYQLQQFGIGEKNIETEYGAEVLLRMTVPLSRMMDVSDLLDGYGHKGWVLEWKWTEAEPDGS